MLSDRDHQANPTILSGNIGMLNDDADNCYHVFITANLTSGAVLDGFHITGGNADDGVGALTYIGIIFNRAFGGGMYSRASSLSIISNCNFYGNRSIAEGGGMYNSNSSPEVSNCNFYGNMADAKGGGMYNSISSPKVSNCNFYDNTATNFGGGMYNLSSSPRVSNCSFYNNRADDGGGGMYNIDPASTPDIINCIFWANMENGNTMSSGAHINNNMGGGNPTISHSLLQVYTGSTSTSIIGQNPLFVNESDPDGADDIPGTADDGLRLHSCSPARDAGEDYGANPNVPVLDILGNGRLAATDMGCYEYQTASVHVYVNHSATGANNGTTWANAYTNLQDALDYACEGEEIWVAEGIYSPSRVPTGVTSTDIRDRSFHLDKDVG
ncbi:MAG: right-handed parallel beta-helix repeat-containing protein, partial [Saprospiraceae bacterium]